MRFMRTTIDLPDNLVTEVMKATGEKTKTKALIRVMEDYLRRKKIERVLQSAGKIEFVTTADKLRKQSERN